MRPVLTGLAAGSLLLGLAAPASAVTVTVNLAGGGAGSVQSSSPAGIECSNVGGGPAGPTCSADLTDSGDFTALLTAEPRADSFLAGWTVQGGFPLAGCTTPPGTVPTCEAALVEPFEATATFELVPDPPTAMTGTASAGADPFLATLGGSVNPTGSEVGDCYFEYGTTIEYGTRTPCVPGAAELGSGMVAQDVSASTEPLEPGTAYHYRLVASNLGGASEGEDRVFTTDPAVDDGCPNFARRLEQGVAALLLPGCMAIEMVSPSQKGGQAARFPQVSATGERVRFRSLAALAGTPSVLNPVLGSTYVATRSSASGWETSPTSPPTGITSGWEGDATPHSFTPDFSRWFQVVATQSQLQVGVSQAFAAGLDGSFTALSPLLVPLEDGNSVTVGDATLRGASADHSHLYFVPGPATATTTAYQPADPVPAGPGAERNAYVVQLDSAGQPSLKLLAQDDVHGKAWGGSCGARLGGADERNQGAISPDGARTYLSTRPGQPAGEPCDAASNGLRILERLEGKQGVWIGELFAPECDRVAPPCSTVDGDDRYQGASVDGARVYLTTTRQLTSSDLDATRDLYLHDAARPIGQRLVQVSAGEDNAQHDAGDGAGVLDGTTAISGDGSHVYYVAEGVLTEDPNPEGAVAQAGEPNLYLWAHETGETGFVGTLDAGDEGGLWGGKGTFRTQAYPVPAVGEDGEGDEVGGDGHILLLESKAPLTADDGDGSHRDVFRYDAEGGELERVSAAAPGGDDDGPFDVTAHRGPIPSVRAAAGTDFAEQNRWVSEDGDAVVFDTEEGLAPGDVNGSSDFYLWRDGQLVRLPGQAYRKGTLENGPVLSHDGSTVAFQTYSRLLPQDGDTAPDVYVARVGGGFPFPAQGVACVPDGEDGCQGGVDDPPRPPTPANAPPGTGNPSFDAPCGLHDRRAGKLRRRAARLRRRARRLSDLRAEGMRLKADRLARRARGLQRSAGRCRLAERGAEG